MPKYNIIPGSILLASTKLDGSAWHRTLVMPLSITNKVTAIIINQMTSSGIETLNFNLPYNYYNNYLYNGGPVKPRELRIVHTLDWETPATTAFYNGVGVTSDTDAIDLFKVHQVPSEYRFVAGSVWWTLERLDAELDQKHWIPVAMNSASILGIPAREQWDFVVNELSRNLTNKYF